MKLIDVRPLRRPCRLTRREFTTALITLLSVLVVGPLCGVIIGVVVTTFDLNEGNREAAS